MKITKIASRLKDYAEIRTNFPDADFWVVRRGTQEAVGKPVKEFSPEHIGIKVSSDDLLPNYLYYALMNAHMSGVFQGIAHGTTDLVNIRAQDIENISLGG